MLDSTPTVFRNRQHYRTLRRVRWHGFKCNVCKSADHLQLLPDRTKRCALCYCPDEATAFDRRRTLDEISYYGCPCKRCSPERYVRRPASDLTDDLQHVIDELIRNSAD